MSNETIYCGYCKISFPNIDQFDKHTREDPDHIRKTYPELLRLYSGIGGEIPYELFEESLKTPMGGTK